MDENHPPTENQEESETQKKDTDQRTGLVIGLTINAVAFVVYLCGFLVPRMEMGSRLSQSFVNTWWTLGAIWFVTNIAALVIIGVVKRDQLFNKMLTGYATAFVLAFLAGACTTAVCWGG